MDTLTIVRTALDIMAAADHVILTNIAVDGYPASRAMLNLRNEERFPGLRHFFDAIEGAPPVYFSTGASSAKVAQIEANHRASACFVVPDELRGVTLAGDISPVTDSAVKNTLWQDEWTTYYPRGAADPEYAVLRLEPVSIRGWTGGEPFSLSF